MLTAPDLIHLPYTPDLSESGCAYACRWLTSRHEYERDYSAAYMRQIAGQVSVELAFRRYLTEQGAPFDVLGLHPFTSPERYNVALGGHRCDVVSTLITRRKQITELREEAGKLLQVPALVPIDEYAAEGQKPEDLYVFAFLQGLETAGWRELHKALGAGQPAYLIHALPGQWARPKKWVPLEGLALKSDCDEPIQIEIGGQDGEHHFMTATLDLPPRQRREVEKDFYSLAYLHALTHPEARIGVHCPRCADPILIRSHEWDNLWFYGMGIILAGWLTHDEFRRKAGMLTTGKRTFLYNATPGKMLALPVKELNPLAGLLEKVKAWDAEKIHRQQ